MILFWAQHGKALCQRQLGLPLAHWGSALICVHDALWPAVSDDVHACSNLAYTQSDQISVQAKETNPTMKFALF